MKPLYKTLLAVALTVTAIVALDFAVGTLCEHALQRSRYGAIYRQNHSMNGCKEDVIIVGSSRAAHHYVPAIISDTTGLSCFNAGSDAMCIYFHYTIIETMIRNGHRPKVVVFDIMPSDIKKTDDGKFNLEAAIERLAPYYGKSAGLDSLIALKGGYERLKFMSKTYRFNSKLVQLMKCNFIPTPEDNGYDPIFRTLPEKARPESFKERSREIEPDKQRYIHKLIQLSRQYHFKLIGAHSPYYGKGESTGKEAIVRLLESENIPFIDMFNEADMMHREYFGDYGHLNDKGARLFTAKFAARLKKYL